MPYNETLGSTTNPGGSLQMIEAGTDLVIGSHVACLQETLQRDLSKIASNRRCFEQHLRVLVKFPFGVKDTTIANSG